MMKHLILFVYFCAAVLVAGTSARADKRVALVIGNDAYQSVPQLTKANNDARAVGRILRELDFEVLESFDIARREMNFKLQSFVNRIDEGDVAFVFYAGHAVEIDGMNYLLPIDIPNVTPSQENFVIAEAIPLNGILAMLRRRKARLNIIVLDACRDNPFETLAGRSVGGTRGLAQVLPPQGTFIMYSADAGEEALDGLSADDPDPNSVFTRTLLPLLQQPGLNLPDLARQTRREVRELAKAVMHDQTPAYYDAVVGDFFFARRPEDDSSMTIASMPSAERQVVSTRTEAAAAIDQELVFWQSVEDSDDPRMIEAYLTEYPTGTFTKIARIRLETLTSPPSVGTEAGAQGLAARAQGNATDGEATDGEATDGEATSSMAPQVSTEDQSVQLAARLAASLARDPAPEAGETATTVASQRLTAEADLDWQPQSPISNGSGRSGLYGSDYPMIPVRTTLLAMQAANIRSLPTSKAPRLGSLKPRTQVAVIGRLLDKNWYQIEYKGQKAFVYAPLLGTADREEQADWRMVRDSRHANAFVAFLQDHPDGRFANEARAWLAALAGKDRDRAVAGVTPVAATAPSNFASRNPRPGDMFKDCEVCPAMVVLPTGALMIGSPTDEDGRLENEGPRRRVIIPNPIAVGRYEVTFEDWDACVQDGGCSHQPSDQGWGRERYPVVNVNWHDAQAYTKWLSWKSGYRYRLLSEAEWEYAARARSQSARHWGETIGIRQANCKGCASAWDNRQSAPAGSFRPNAFGLHDMLGNVWEWTEDCWNDSHKGATSIAQPRVEGQCQRRVLRGGGWFDGPEMVRSAVRVSRVTDLRYYVIGFRVARDLY